MSFNQIIGHEHNIGILQKSITADRLPGSYLFIGDEGIGKGQVALNLAKAINCQDDTLNACDKCASCLKIDKGNHPDIHRINPDETGSIKIETVREIQKNINLKPYEAKIKIFIMNDAHTLTLEASNALLKVLEEPPDRSLFILISSQPNLLLSTIISRCQRLRFSPLSKNRLKGILGKDYNLDTNASHYLSYFYEGRLGGALRHKDEDVLGQKNRVIDIFTKERDAALDYDDKAEIKEDLEILLKWFRDIYLAKLGIAHSELVNIDRKHDLLTDMSRYSYEELDEIMNFIYGISLYLEQNINPKLLMSNLKVKLWTR